MDSPLNILVVEDHDDLRDATVAALAAKGHAAMGIACAEDIDEMLGRIQPDIFLIDLGLPGEDGLSLARRLRAAQPDVGIIMVTARDSARDTLHGYDSGADIYVAKPTSPDELDAAIRALSRRLHVAPATAEHLKLYPSILQLHGPLGKVDVTDNELSLLMALSKARDHRLETWQMIELCGKTTDEPGKSALEVQIVRLRKKLQLAGATPPTIKAIRGVGYQLCSPVVVRKGTP